MVSDLDKFNIFFSENYQRLSNFAHTVSNSYTNDNLDLLHDCYTKIAKRIKLSGFTGNITGFTMITIRNSMLSNQSKFKPPLIELSLEEYDVEIALKNINDNDKDSQQYREEIRYLSKLIFEYLSTRYNQKELYIFRNYFLTAKMTYRKLSATTGYSIAYCGNVIKRIKIDLKNNFILWLNDKPVINNDE